MRCQCTSHPTGARAPWTPSSVRPGGVLVMHDGRAVVAHYGSAAGELAACVSAVGLADRSDLTKLVLEGPPAQLQHLSQRLTGSEIAPGGAVLSGGAWWCAERPERMLVDLRRGPRRASARRAACTRGAAFGGEPHRSQRRPGRRWPSSGRRASALLAELGVYGASGNPRHVPPLTAHTGRRRRGPVAAGVRRQGPGADGHRGRRPPCGTRSSVPASASASAPWARRRWPATR